MIIRNCFHYSRLPPCKVLSCIHKAIPLCQEMLKSLESFDTSFKLNWSKSISIEMGDVRGNSEEATGTSKIEAEQGGKRELLMRAMALPSVWSVLRVAIPFIWVVGLLSLRLAGASQDSGTVIPAESRPCVDCHAFEFMQRALQDLKKTAYNLDTRTETLLLRAEQRGLCDCFHAIH
ncbi:hypothetical protein llap_5775 [Limosa lapponica baueri]|uniref:NELL2-interacting cell ontogeny regulator 1 n=1 Tax=Limosa lapponica baueri TaxID=1758121 RepID=A0A2I0UD05_LIMLA|nr:hypothetical protein llap_5775 [Limosa lapponica baueri]